MSALHLPHDTAAFSVTAFLALTAMWVAMMSAMMAPTAWSWVQAFRRFGLHDTRGGRRIVETALFAGGYLAAWLLYSLAAAGLQLALLQQGVFDADAGMPPLLSGGVLVAAGAFQFAPLKRACLTHCRNPFSYLLSRWRNGPANGFRIGFGHGIFCVGCCWALMATALAVGVMNVWWMAALAVAAFVEQVAPKGDQVRVLLGVSLIAAGGVQFYVA